jgi:hypothetical protein
MVSPRTRNLPRPRFMSLRSYCMSTSAQHLALVVAPRPDLHVELVAVLLGRAQAVDARHRGHHDDVAPGEQRRGGRVAQPVDLVVDRRVLLDVGVARGHVGLGLVVVVVADEVLDPVVGEELRNSLASWAASDLLGAMTSVGRCTCSMVQAMVALLPEPVMPSSVWNRSPEHHHVVGLLLGGQPPGDLRPHRRVDDPVERGEGVGVGEHDRRQRRSVECAVGGHDPRPEPLHDGGEHLGSRLLELASDGVGVDDHRAPFGQQRRDGRLPRPDATRQPDHDHGGRP